MPADAPALDFSQATIVGGAPAPDGSAQPAAPALPPASTAPAGPDFSQAQIQFSSDARTRRGQLDPLIRDPSIPDPQRQQYEQQWLGARSQELQQHGPVSRFMDTMHGINLGDMVHGAGGALGNVASGIGTAAKNIFSSHPTSSLLAATDGLATGAVADTAKGIADVGQGLGAQLYAAAAPYSSTAGDLAAQTELNKIHADQTYENFVTKVGQSTSDPAAFNAMRAPGQAAATVATMGESALGEGGALASKAIKGVEKVAGAAKTVGQVAERFGEKIPVVGPIAKGVRGLVQTGGALADSADLAEGPTAAKELYEAAKKLGYGAAGGAIAGGALGGLGSDAANNGQAVSQGIGGGAVYGAGADIAKGLAESPIGQKVMAAVGGARLRAQTIAQNSSPSTTANGGSGYSAQPVTPGAGVPAGAKNVTPPPAAPAGAPMPVTPNSAPVPMAIEAPASTAIVPRGTVEVTPELDKVAVTQVPRAHVPLIPAGQLVAESEAGMAKSAETNQADLSKQPFVDQGPPLAQHPDAPIPPYNPDARTNPTGDVAPPQQNQIRHAVFDAMLLGRRAGSKTAGDLGAPPALQANSLKPGDTFSVLGRPFQVIESPSPNHVIVNYPEGGFDVLVGANEKLFPDPNSLNQPVESIVPHAGGRDTRGDNLQGYGYNTTAGPGQTIIFRGPKGSVDPATYLYPGAALHEHWAMGTAPSAAQFASKTFVRPSVKGERPVAQGPVPPVRPMNARLTPKPSLPLAGSGASP